MKKIRDLVAHLFATKEPKPRKPTVPAPRASGVQPATPPQPREPPKRVVATPPCEGRCPRCGCTAPMFKRLATANICNGCGLQEQFGTQAIGISRKDFESGSYRNPRINSPAFMRARARLGR